MEDKEIKSELCEIKEAIKSLQITAIQTINAVSDVKAEVSDVKGDLSNFKEETRANFARVRADIKHVKDDLDDFIDEEKRDIDDEDLTLKRCMQEIESSINKKNNKRFERLEKEVFGKKTA